MSTVADLVSWVVTVGIGAAVALVVLQIVFALDARRRRRKIDRRRRRRRGWLLGG